MGSAKKKLQAVDEDLVRMATILEDEITGRPVDRAAARRLAMEVASACPDIAFTMKMVADRLAANS